MNRLISAAVVAASLMACAGGAVHVRPASADPSNPAAPEGRAAPSSEALTGNAPPPAAPVGEAPAQQEEPRHPGHDHHHGRAAPAATHPAQHADGHVQPAKATAPAATVYSCPMHPEVTQAEPGRCPKCKMKLTQQQPGGERL